MKTYVQRTLLICLLALSIGISTAGFVFAVESEVFKSLTVRIHEKDGLDFSVKIPTFLAKTALHFFPHQLSDMVCDEIAEWGPAIAAACSEIEICPDETLIEIESDREVIRVIKDRGALIVDLFSPGESITIAVPMDLMVEVLDQFDLER